MIGVVITNHQAHVFEQWQYGGLMQGDIGYFSPIYIAVIASIFGVAYNLFAGFVETIVAMRNEIKKSNKYLARLARQADRTETINFSLPREEPSL